MRLNFKPFTLLLLLITCLSSWSYAQKPDIKFGKVSKEELQMKSYTQDSSASAVILADFGDLRFDYLQGDGFFFVFERHIRIKVLNKEGYDWADFEIPLYHNGNKSERLESVKAYTFNLNEKGKKEKISLSKKGILEEKVSNKLSVKKFTMPAVKEGSVIDVRYSIKSDFLINLQNWEFQHSIPTVWSEYKLSIPEIYHYIKRGQGYIPFIINQQGYGDMTISYIPKSTINQGRYVKRNRNNGQPRTINYRTEEYHFAAQHIPAFENEFAMASSKNYISKIEFQLATINFPGELPEEILYDWNKIAKELSTHNNFGDAFDNSRVLSETAQALTKNLTTDGEKITAIHNWVKNKISWNKKNNYLTENDLDKILESGSGNAAEINLILTTLLNKAGFDATPVVMSTRSHGKVQPMFPMIEQINYVVAHVQLGDQKILLDATQSSNPAGSLPFYCLNGQGLLIDKDSPRWIDLRTNESFNTSTTVMLSFTDELELTGSHQKIYKSLSALSIRQKIKNSGEEDYFEKIGEKFENWDIQDLSFDKLEELDQPVRRIMKIVSMDASTKADFLYLDLLPAGEVMKENPFKKEKRIYPVDFGSPFQEKYMLNLQLPEGYEVEELPEPINLILPDNAARYLLSVNQKGNFIQILSLFDLNKTTFLPNEYDILKDFYNRIITKQAQKIVLKKSTPKAKASVN